MKMHNLKQDVRVETLSTEGETIKGYVDIIDDVPFMVYDECGTNVEITNYNIVGIWEE